MHDAQGRTGAHPHPLLGGALLLAAIITLPSCASWNALKNYPRAPDFCASEVPQPACQDLSFVAEQVKLAGTAANNVTDAMKFDLAASTTLDVATAGLATAFGVKLVHGNTLTTGAKNLAFAAGATYAAGTLFFPRTTEQTQVSTRSALMCVAARGNDLLATYNSLATVTNAATREAATLFRCQAERGYQEMAKAQASAQAVLNAAQDTQLSLAQLLFRARLAAHDGQQAQLDAQRPSQDAFLAAGKSALTAAGSLASTTAPSSNATPKSWFDSLLLKTEKFGFTHDVAPVSACTDDDRTKIRQLQNTFESIKPSQLDGAINAVADASKDCLASTPTLISPLSVSQSAVTLHPGETGTVVVVSGGRPPLSADWVDTLPKVGDAGFSWLVANQQIRLAAPAAAPGGGPYTLRIRDSAARPASLDITVTTVK